MPEGSPLLLTFRHRAGVSPYTSCSTLQRPVFLVNSRQALVCATPSRSIREGLHGNEVLLLPKLRSQLAEFLNEGYLNALGFSPHPPVLV